MKRLTGLLIALLGLTTMSFAQQKKGKVTGQVIDGNSKIIEAATISLVRAKDSSVAKISVADKLGKFVFENIDEGKYMVSISAVGHNKAFSPQFEINEAHTLVELKTIELVQATKTLGAVTVSSKKPLIEQKIDRTIVNVEAAATNVGSSALEVLEKSPGVSVDKDGNISLKGKQGVQVYIDGRPSYLSGTDLANLLRSMNSNQLETIEIMTNPPARYDAAGNSGIINIRTKKNKQFGYNGSLTVGYGQGVYPKTNESFNFNYRKNKINLFTNLSYNYRKNFNDLYINRKFINASDKQVKSLFSQGSYIREHGSSMSAKFGMDYYASKKTTLGFVVSGFNNPGKFSNHSDVNISTAANVLEGITRANTNNDRKWKNFSTNINLRQLLDTSGTELTADLDYLNYNSKNLQDLVNAYYDPNGQANRTADTLLGNLPQNINIYSAKIDFSKPLKKNAKIEAGFKTSYVKTDANAIYDSLINNSKVSDLGRSNHFIYNENVNAAYVNVSKEFNKKWSGQFGVRVENTIAKGNQVTTGQTFKRDYTQVFPTLFLQYTANAKHTFGVNYGRRIERPDYEDMNPFVLFLDKYTFQQGNPNLQPQFAHNIELTHTFKGFLTTTLNYTKTTDIIQEVLEQNTDKNETYIKKSNIANQRQYGISVAAGFPVAKWWNANLYGNVFNNKYDGIINGGPVVVEATTGQFNVSNQFKFNNGWSAEVSGFYTTPMLWGVFKIKSLGSMNIGVSKQVMKGKGSLRFNVRDVLLTNKANGSSRYSNIDASFHNVRESRVANLSFTYRFNKGKVAQRRRTGGAGDEQSRVKAGNEN
ncbi:MAG: TonB-dependent receptor [Sphingobacteriales bacterium]|nr:MAG: TonB-dependent receptor [Sphingobacteriales bacterium]